MQQYIKALEHVMNNGTDKEDRTGIGTRSVFGYQMRFDLNDGFPAVTTKKLAFKAVKSELLWFIEGSTDERRLAEIHFGKPAVDLEDKTTIWTANADQQGKALGYYNSTAMKELGPVYGFQWRKWNAPEEIGTGVVLHEIDQLANLINDLKNNPDSRRHILSSWNVADIDKMALPPCHCLAQFYVADGKLSCQLYQRSADLAIGSPFNVASYALLTHMIAQVCGYDVGEFVYSIGDCHIYKNHFDQVREQMTREPKPLPKLWLDPSITDIDLFTMDSIKLIDYDSYPPLKMPMAV